MISTTYSHQSDNAIYTHEETMLDLYTQQIKNYEPSFQAYGCTIKTGLMWKLFPSTSKSFSRKQIQDGYECYVYCSIEKDGDTVYIKSNDGEADYYPLSTAWMISAARRRWFSLKVRLFSDVDDVAICQELNEFILLLGNKNVGQTNY